ncbi:MAG: SOS mutagenesis and repair protein UmuC [Ignavibacteriae bacterium]|nr:MAG: SOS mutagenesis and repair protein UmuC [Ignavibacteriota bacterium]
MFGLVDCNNFYASCERIFRPELNNKPIVVLSNNDGCVIARSNEAKLLGIPMAAPAFKFEKIFREKNIHIFSSNYPLYGDMSKRVMSLLSNLAPEIEVYSIDEAFLKFENSSNINFQEYGEKIKKVITKSTGLPISIGLAKTKALSKVANKIAKNFSEKTNNVYVIGSEEQRIKALKWIKIENTWGIGRGYTRQLKQIGINTAYKFTGLSELWIKKNMGITGLKLKQDLLGIPTLDLEKNIEKKHIGITRSFEEYYTKLEQIEERIATFAVTCAEKLRKQNSTCNALVVFIRTNRKRKNLPQYRKNIFIPLPFATNSGIEISKFAISGLRQIFEKGYLYKRAGVIVTEIRKESEIQIELFQNSNPKHKPLMEAIDKLNNSIGQDKIKLASQDPQRTWKMKQERLSPRYTTHFSEILNVKAK